MKDTLKCVLFLGVMLFSFLLSAQSTAPDEDGSPYTTCNADGANATRTSNDLTPRVNVGTIDDRTCYANYKESSVNGKTWGVYNITHDSNHLDTNGLQPRMERSLSRSQEVGVGSYAEFKGTVRILEVGKTSNSNNDGTYIMQAKGKHTGTGGSNDPAICLYLAKPVYDVSGTNQISFNIYREQINYRGGSGTSGRTFVFLKNILKNVETSIELKVGFRQDPSDASKRIHYSDAIIGGTVFNWNIPEPERGTQSGIRYGAYRIKGGRAQIRWANTTYQKVEVVHVPTTSTVTTITSTKSGDWTATSTWVGGVVPTISDDVVIAHAVRVKKNVTAEMASLTIGGSGCQLRIDNESIVKVTGAVSITRSQDGMAFYAQGGPLGSFTYGSVSQNKRVFVRPRLLVNNKWSLISSPLKESRMNEIAEKNSSNVVTTATNIALASFNDANGAGLKYDYYKVADSPHADSEHLTLGKGYSIRINNASDGTKPDHYQRGVLQTTFPVDIAISDAGNGFNLLGNPLLGYLNVNDAADGTNNILRGNGLNGADILAEDTIWLWDSANEAWVTKNLGSTSYKMPGVQGFFVKAKTGGGTFSFTKAMQSDSGDAFLKSSSSRFEIDLSISNGEKNRSTSIKYIDSKTTSFDNGYDSSLFGGYASVLEVYTGLVEGGSAKKLAIQSLPNANFEDMIVPVGVTAGVNSEITFTAEALNVPAGYKVFLEDRLNNTFTRLDETNAKYTATVTDKSTEGRFYLHTRSAALSVDSELLNSISIYKSNNATLRIVGLSQGNTSISLYNVFGKQVFSSKFNTTSVVKELALPKLATGVYIVQLETETGKLNKKIVLE
ncbi:MAG: T9SS type A sorting domain-containing protein [Polaribacter sp.]